MSFFNDIKKALSGNGEPNNDQEKPQEDVVPSNSGKPKAMEKDEKADFQLLLSLYKKHKGEQEINFAALVKAINPEATPQMCPYCRTVNDFTATRARKCPVCSKRMIVRQGLFITEEQAAQLEKLVQQSYTKQGLVTRIGYILDGAQNAKVQKRSVEYFRALAEGFRYTAQIENHRDSNGYSFWDKAWGYYGSARLEEMRGMKDPTMMQYSSLPDILWDMAQMILDQTNGETKDERIKKGKKQALTQACMTLAEAAKLGTTPYYSPQLYMFAKKIMGELGMTAEELGAVSDSAATTMRLTGTPLDTYNTWIKELSEYEIIEHPYA